MSNVFAHFTLSDPGVWELVRHHVKEHARHAIENGKPLHLFIVSDDAPAQDSQRAHYWCILRQIADDAWIADTQFEPAAWHELLCAQFLGHREVVDAKGKPKLVRRSISRTADPPVTVGEMAKYTEEVMAYASNQFGIVFGDKP